MHRAVIALVLGPTLILAGCASTSTSADSPTSSTAAAPDPMAVTKATFRGTWPLSVSSATIVCGTVTKQSVGVTVDGTTYALNGPGETFEHWPALDAPVWMADPQIEGAKVNVGDLIDYARTKCGDI